MSEAQRSRLRNRLHVPSIALREGRTEA